MEEKYTIRITDNGLLIAGSEGKKLHLTAGEALMLLDILQNEEQNLRRMANKASPMPLRIQIKEKA